MELGKMDRAADFVRLDAGSEWAAYVTPSILLREGKIQEAREAVKRMPNTPRYHRDLLEACLQLRPAAELDRMGQEAETSVPARSKLLYICWRARSGKTIARMRICFPILCWQSSEQIQRLTKC